jgi:putative pyruvate formate lyase activating enzyme
MVEMPPNVLRLGREIRRCGLCPRRCGVNRQAGQIGACRIGSQAVVASAGPHFGEEPCLVGNGGSGTIFFTGCNLACVFCQNADISQGAEGLPRTPMQIAEIALGLQGRGCRNINFVTPTHVAHAVAEAVVLARASGLTIPTVYNCGGYESVGTLACLEGLIDIYMPDFKWADEPAGRKYSGVADYPAVATAGLAEMHRQVGPLRLDARGEAIAGLLVRHLVMPGDLAHSGEAIDVIASTAPGCTVNIMSQYHPAFHAGMLPELAERPQSACIDRLRRQARSRGLRLAR